MALRYGEFYGDGVFTVPAGVTSIFITACGGGGGGSGAIILPANRPIDFVPGMSYHATKVPGIGGNAADFIINQQITVFPGENIHISIGKGGIGGEPYGASLTDTSAMEPQQVPTWSVIPSANGIFPDTSDSYGKPGEATVLGPFASLQGAHITLDGGAATNNPSDLITSTTKNNLNPADGQTPLSITTPYGGYGGHHSLGGGGGGGMGSFDYGGNPHANNNIKTGGNGGISPYFAWGGDGGGTYIQGFKGQGLSGGDGGVTIPPAERMYNASGFTTLPVTGGGGGGGGAMGGGGGGGGFGMLAAISGTSNDFPVTNFSINLGGSAGGGQGGHGYVLITWANPDTTD
jgi:hypothetical protein